MLLRVQAREDPELFLRNYETPLIIDEFQYAPESLTYIKIRVDGACENEMFHDKEKAGTMYYLTGYMSSGTLEKSAYIDLLIFYDNKVYPIEIKKSTSPSINAIKNFYVVNEFGVSVGNGIVLCMVKEIMPVKDNCYLVPIGCI